ncbi:MAG: 50S ribosomal protein L24 [Spirochaetes bacterium]|jgi:large subunit ribosomal protein L24|nr:50S ribosomal protein L24 [Spirochaetota bacterium]
MKVESTKTKLKVNDNVVVISGADKGKRGKILKINRNSGRVIIEGINKRKKFLRPNQENPQGGFITMEFPINLSNVMLFCDKCKKGVRIGMETKDKQKTRVCKKCGKSLDK